MAVLLLIQDKGNVKKLTMVYSLNEGTGDFIMLLTPYYVIQVAVFHLYKIFVFLTFKS